MLIKDAHWEQAWALTHSTEALQKHTNNNNFWSLLSQGIIQEYLDYQEVKSFMDISFP